MKLLKRILLIKWHYIEHQLIEFENINFLTGKNASGKSTLIDALQVIILGDTNGHFFNKAANDNSRRTFKGYLRGEVGDDGDTGFIYLRNGDFTSYIVCEFFDTDKKKYISTGLVVDCYNDGNHDHDFFIFDGAIPDNHFIKDNTPLNRSNLKAYLANNYKNKFTFYRSNRSYQSAFLGKMGGLNEKFFRLIKKAVPFSPITDIKGFISEFVCDIKNEVDIQNMQDNIRYYKLLENEAETVKEKIAHLEEIKKAFEDYEIEDKRFMEQSYLVDKAKEESHYYNISELNKKIISHQEEIKSFNSKINELDKQREALKVERENLFKEKISSDVYKKAEEYKSNKSLLQEKIKKLEYEKENLLDMVKKHYYSWRENISRLAEIKNNSRLLIEVDTHDIMKNFYLLKNMLDESFDEISSDKLCELSNSMKKYIYDLKEIYFNLKGKIKGYNDKIEELRKEIINLEQGIRSYSKGLITLKKEIEDRLSKKYSMEINTQIFCEMIDIKNKKWQDAIEGYLHTQKFYLIVEPKYYIDALKIYDEIKIEKNIYDIGLVDVEKLLKFNPNRLSGSLAEEIITESRYARAFADYLLGRVSKSERVEDLRKHKISITPTCMLYQNFVARQLNPERYAFPYIGKNSIKKQLEIKKDQLKKTENEKKSINEVYKIVTSLKDIEWITENDISNIIYRIDEIRPLKKLKMDLQEIIDKLGDLDFTFIQKIDKMINFKDDDIKKIETKIRSIEKAIGIKENEVSNMADKEIPQEETSAEIAKKHIQDFYNREWVTSTGYPRYESEIEKRKTPENILNAFSSQIKRSESQKNKKWQYLTNARLKYIEKYKLSHDILDKNNDVYSRELENLVNTLMIEYEEKIKDSKEKAKVQFQEDFISKLRRNIEDVKEQIDDLNKALKDVPFGKEKYRFSVEPNRQYKDYYDMITDNMLLEGFNLFSLEFQSRHQDAIEELFKQIVDIGEAELDAQSRMEIENNLMKFTDYRTYLDFDLITKDDSGRESRLSKVITKKSGGETQTPFYISVLASFVQTYRIKQKSYNNTLRLIIFDEAYSKMDHQRIQESMKLLRKLGLQVIVSAPTEKIADIAPLVDRTLCVTRFKNQTVIEGFDPKTVLEE